MKNNEYRCSGCNEIRNVKNLVWVAWNRTKLTKTKDSSCQGMCRKCARAQRPNETGKALSDRIMFGKGC
ncbi:MAG: hypothetical protein EBZ49_04925 [Proteobacteria bacterium]|nr:hypothetical protein [Pseudomonadota bacterium]